MADSAGSPLKSVEWFPVAGGPKPEGGVGSALVKLGVGAAVGGLLFASRHATAAYVVWGIAGTVGAISIASASARQAIDGALAKFGRAVGSVIGAVLLTIVYVVVVTPTRFVRRVLGADDLHLRDADRPTYWLPCDDDERKVRWVGSMFATEVRPPRGNPLRTAIVAFVALFLLAEGVARTRGFGDPVLYVADPVVGYYTAPDMKKDRYGGLVQTNRWGMRSDDVAEKKPAGTFRILMLGDSTLYGGSYIDQADLYASILPKLLNQGKGLPGKVEILAMGVNGWGPFHERGYVTKFGVFEADLAIINMPCDDINRPLYGLMSVPFFSNKQPPKLALEEFANHFMWRYRSAHAGLDDAWEQEQSQLGIAEYGRLVDDLKAKGVPEVMAAILPNRSSGTGGPEEPREVKWIGQLLDTFEKHGAHPYYAKGYFAGKGKAEELYYDNVHLHVKGHRLYAEFFATRLMEDSAQLRRFAGLPPKAPAPTQKPTDDNRPAVERQ
jgi:hypothetical protein